LKLLLGVTGGIAAYKAADLTSQAIKAGFEVRVMMTPSATRFVGPLTFEALTGHAVFVDLLATGEGDAEGPSSIRHISWARWPDMVCLAPLTMTTLGKLAVGIADNAVTTVVHALEPQIPVLLCPAMNTQMWDHPTTRRNLSWIAETGRYQVVAPTAKRLACGEVGVGGLAEVPDILAALLAVRSA
jgi:phosphopantothenoylcysteine decarboxylase/phosphopantothenate--cysteine ligase